MSGYEMHYRHSGLEPSCVLSGGTRRKEMPWRTMMLGAAAIASIVGTNLMMSQRAQARPAGYTLARDPLGNMMADGHAWAEKKSRACNRAERRCKRELERKRRQGKTGRGSCMRVTND